MLGVVGILLGERVHLHSSIGLLSSTELTGMDVDVGTVEKNIRHLVSQDDPEVPGEDPWTFNLVLSVLLNIGECCLGDTLLLGRKRFAVEIEVGVGTLGLDVTIDVLGSLLGLSFGRSSLSAMDSVVGDVVDVVLSIGRCLSGPEERTEEEVPPSESVVFSDDLAVNVRKPEKNREDGDTETGQNDGQGDSEF